MRKFNYNIEATVSQCKEVNEWLIMMAKICKFRFACQQFLIQPGRLEGTVSENSYVLRDMLIEADVQGCWY